MKYFIVTGMSCAACSSHVEKAVSKVAGVRSVSVSLLTNSMQVEGTATSEEIIRAVEASGYGASERGEETTKKSADQEDALADVETPKMKKRLCASILFLVPLMYLSMGVSMWHWPAPAFVKESHINMALSQMILTSIVMLINQKFFLSGLKSMKNKAPNMDALVALGSGAAFLYSTGITFLLAYHIEKGHMEHAMHYAHDLYFESAAMILTLITVGKMLEARSKGKTTNALKGLMKLAPKNAIVKRDGLYQEVSVSDVKIGETYMIYPGAQIPVDGVVVEGSSAVNESALTGESLPVDKEPGSRVSAGTLNQSGNLVCRATRVGEDTTLSQIIQMVSDAAASKAPIAKIADRVSGVFVPVVICISLLSFFAWLALGENVGFAIGRAISVLVISCPCALGLATPVAIMVGNGLGAQNGILFKTASSLEVTGKAQVVVLDKTGTITEGKPRVTDVLPFESCTSSHLLEVAGSLEALSEHPLAHAIVDYCKENKVLYHQVESFRAEPGNGLKGMLGDTLCYAGNAKYMGRVMNLPETVNEEIDQLAMQGKTPLLFSEGTTFLGIIAVADTIKNTSVEAIRLLKNLGIHVTMLTGDHQKTAEAIAKIVGTDEVIAGVLPSGKEEVIREYQKQNLKVAMVGDGINDAPALTRAEIGIAIGAGADVAVDAADVVLMKSDLMDVVAAIRLSRQVLKNIYENLFWAFFYNCLGIPIAAGMLYPLFGIKLNPMFGAAAMSLSSFCVVSNALRLNFTKLYDAHKDKKIKGSVLAIQQNKEEKETKKMMTKTLKIEGMMCGHCEAHVKKALEKMEGVKEATPSHTENKAVVVLEKEIPEEEFKAVIEACDYTFLGME